MGDFPEIEFTGELFRGWPAAQDSLQSDDLDKSNGASESQYPDYPNAWRLWTFNFDGSFNGLRPEITAAFDVTSLLGVNNVPKRRRLYDCLAYGEQLYQRARPILHWLNTDPEDGGVPRWEAVPDKWPWELSDRDGSILFTGDKPPQELIDLGANARLRLTATIRSDTRILGTANRVNTSPNGNTITLVLEVADKFVKRVINADGANASINAGLTSTFAAIRDDSTAIQEFAEQCRGEEDLARLRASFTLHGLQHQYRLGSSVDKIDGRNISLNRANKSQGLKRYLQITGITLDVENAKTSLQVDTLMLKARDLDTGLAVIPG